MRSYEARVDTKEESIIFTLCVFRPHIEYSGLIKSNSVFDKNVTCPTPNMSKVCEPLNPILIQTENVI